MDQRRTSAAQPALPSSLLLSEDLYDLLQGNRFSTTTSTTSASPTTSTLSSGAATTLSDVKSNPNSLQDPLNHFIFDQIAPAPGALKMEPEIGDFMSNSYNWMPTTQLYNVDSLSCLTNYNTNHLPHQLPSTSQFSYSPPQPSVQSSSQIQALRDFMVYGNLADPIMPTPQFSSAVSSRATTPIGNSLLYQLDDVGTDSLIGISPGVQSKPQDMNLAYRALCSEIYATERSPHRSQFQRENHILAERQRREEMNEKFSALRAMIPKATKKDKASIVGDTIDYVLELEKRLKHLQACKDTASGSPFIRSLKRKSPSTSANTASVHQDSPTDAVTKDCDAPDHRGTNPATTTTSSPSSTSPSREGHSAVNSPSDQVTQESKLQAGKKAAAAEVEVQSLGSRAVIKIVVERRPGHVLSVLNALEECKVEVMQSNVMTVGESSIHFVTVQLEEGASASTEELVSAILQAINPPKAKGDPPPTC
ncbi:uncharacterized protein [Physcomitrium patens]|uniref:BHLH domain-containing protein n=1 Tax=Physcomitrium patens TaxID=3218 RepID=A9SKT1_PHYPA|nr:transcription factor FAMA-like isoform X2 [Physcomitrium patens]PNR48406.1 hypothetical protein PHYPA_012882 [Physcomitrium patens]|eukprot:XP_024384192.1 transcription factor FAMA-like isoform X2 [Physcomitrella patens]